MPDLTGFPALDVAIGLGFLYFLLATVASLLNESIASLLGWRAKTLEQAISNLLGDKDLTGELRKRLGRLNRNKIEAKVGQTKRVGDTDRFPEHLTTNVLEHWAVKALVSDPTSDKRRQRRPSYLPASVFSLAVSEVVAEGSAALPEVVANNRAERVRDAGTALRSAGASEAIVTSSAEPAPGPAEPTAQPPDADAQPGGAPEQPTGPERPAGTPWQVADQQLFDAINHLLAQLPEGQARSSLQRAATDAGNSLEGFRTNLEGAFDAAMDRASGWYKRKSQAAIFVIAALLAFGFNVDSLKVGTRLWKDEAVRTAVTTQALNTLNQGQTGSGGSAGAQGGAQDPGSTATLTADEKNVPKPDPCRALVGASGNPPPPTEPIACAKQRAEAAGKTLSQVDQLNLPIGWGAGNAPTDWGWLLALPGWLITLFAISLGAPFWFDVLGKLARLRGSGPSAAPDTTGSNAPTSDAQAAAGTRSRLWQPNRQ